MTTPILDRPSPNQRARPAGSPIDTLVLHYTGMQSTAAALDRLRDPAAGVSSHYLVDEDATVYRLVDEAARAAHAGVSFWRGVHDLNDRSIGIEIVNPGHHWGYRPFPSRQIDAVIALATGLLARHPIPVRNVVGHSDIAPDRKQDPGELFPWPTLAARGIGFWPDVGDADASDPAPAGTDALMRHLLAIGYPDMGAATVVTAFQRRWRPDRVDGHADRGTTVRAAAVAAGLG